MKKLFIILSLLMPFTSLCAMQKQSNSTKTFMIGVATGLTVAATVALGYHSSDLVKTTLKVAGGTVASIAAVGCGALAFEAIKDKSSSDNNQLFTVFVGIPSSIAAISSAILAGVAFNSAYNDYRS